MLHQASPAAQALGFNVPSLKVMEDAHAGSAAVVLGGGPTLMGDVARAIRLTPAPVIYFSVNWRALNLVRCRYVVWMDKFYREGSQRRPIIERVDRDGVQKLTQFIEHTDFDFDGLVPKALPHSGAVAVFIAAYMGCGPIYLGGMDGYSSDRAYFDSEPGDFLPSHKGGLPAHLHSWLRVRELAPGHGAQVRALSGPLADMFGLAGDSGKAVSQ